MPKREKKKDSDYLRFRPYRAFVSQPEESSDRWSNLTRFIVVVGAIVVLFLVAMSLAHK